MESKFVPEMHIKFKCSECGSPLGVDVSADMSGLNDSFEYGVHDGKPEGASADSYGKALSYRVFPCRQCIEEITRPATDFAAALSGLMGGGSDGKK